MNALSSASFKLRLKWVARRGRSPCATLWKKPAWKTTTLRVVLLTHSLVRRRCLLGRCIRSQTMIILPSSSPNFPFLNCIQKRECGAEREIAHAAFSEKPAGKTLLNRSTLNEVRSLCHFPPSHAIVSQRSWENNGAEREIRTPEGKNPTGSQGRRLTWLGHLCSEKWGCGHIDSHINSLFKRRFLERRRGGTARAWGGGDGPGIGKGGRRYGTEPS